MNPLSATWSRLCLCVSMGLGSVMGLSGCATDPGQEGRYYTWVDETGQVRTSPIVEAANPLEERAKAVGRDAQSARSSARQSSDSDGNTIPSMGEASANAAGVPATAASAPYTLEHYPDGNEVEKAGRKLREQDLPYFTWRDAEGRQFVTPYYPAAPSTVRAARLSATRAPSQAQIYGPEAASMATSEAWQRLGLDQTRSVFEMFTVGCCERFKGIDEAVLPGGRSALVDVDAQAPRFPFATGRSHYRLVRLEAPENGRTRTLEIRSVVNQSVFVPSLIFMDASMTPSRVVTQIVFEHLPERWHRRATLRAYLDVPPDESWVLIMSTAEDARGVTFVEGDGETRAIPHGALGSLALEWVEE